MFRSAEALFRPKSIAIVGASDGGYARRIFENLEAAQFPTEVFLINPRRDLLWDRPVYKDYDALPAAPDLALAVISESYIPDSLTKAAARGVKASIVYASDFGEGGSSEGLARAKALQSICEKSGLRICGPNCMGVISVKEQLCLYPTARVRSLPSGPVGVVFQSGGTFQFWLQQGATRGLGYSYAVSSGNELDLDVADYINFMVEDAGTKVITCLIEGIRRPQAFCAAAEKALQAGKPILVIKIGRSERGKASTQTHTGSLAGDDEVFNAVCKKYGIVRCDTLDDLIETALVFQSGRLPAGKRIAMVGFSGGTKGMFLDYAADAGAELARFSEPTIRELVARIDKSAKAENPLDVGAAASRKAGNYTEICRLVLTDPGVDILALQGQLPMDADEPGSDRADYTALTEASNKPVVVFGRMHQNVTADGRAIQRAAAVPYLQGIPDAIRALQRSIQYGAAVRQQSPVEPSGARTGRTATRDIKALFQTYGLQLPNEAMAKTPADAAAAAKGAGFPVALKIVSPDASHKTEVGGVALNLTDASQVEVRAHAMLAQLRAVNPTATVDGFLVQEMVSGVEMIVGARNDEQFGPVIVAGLGGVTAELLRDVSIRLAPVDEHAARDMLAELRGAPLLGQFRGRPARDTDALVSAITALSQLYLEHRLWITEIEINPLIVLEQGRGVRAVDVRVVKAAVINQADR
jgi:acetate---CoA ligase (ADP-forming)